MSYTSEVHKITKIFMYVVYCCSVLTKVGMCQQVVKLPTFMKIWSLFLRLLRVERLTDMMKLRGIFFKLLIINVPQGIGR